MPKKVRTERCTQCKAELDLNRVLFLNRNPNEERICRTCVAQPSEVPCSARLDDCRGKISRGRVKFLTQENISTDQMTCVSCARQIEARQPEVLHLSRTAFEVLQEDLVVHSDPTED